MNTTLEVVATDSLPMRDSDEMEREDRPRPEVAVTAAPRDAAFNPSQARVPAGHPDGGQWTDDGSEFLEPIGPQSEEFPFEDSKDVVKPGVSGDMALSDAMQDQEDEFDEAVWGIGGRWSAQDAKRSVEQLIGAHLEQQLTSEELREMANLLGLRARELTGNEDFKSNTKLAQEIANQITHHWAMSSGDTHAWSVLMQDAIRQEFDLNDAGFDHLADGKGAAKAWSQLGIASGQSDKFESEDTRQRDLITRVLRAHARAQYTETQLALTEAGIEHLDLVRGMAFGGSTPDESRDSAFDIARTGVATLQPASSFSLSFNTARDFSYRSTSNHLTSVVLRTRVPRRRILSFPKTGFGCLNESEIVVLGGKIKTRIMYWLD